MGESDIETNPSFMEPKTDIFWRLSLKKIQNYKYTLHIRMNIHLEWQKKQEKIPGALEIAAFLVWGLSIKNAYREIPQLLTGFASPYSTLYSSQQQSISSGLCE